MTYNDVAEMTADFSLIRRLTAGAASESIEAPEQWVQEHKWELTSQPGWSEAWASAVAGENPDPGKDEGVITDGMILSGIQAVNTP